MKRFVLSVLAVTVVGLGVVTAEIEAVKTGYAIRQLSLNKLDLVNRMKRLEFEIADLKTPARLERWMSSRNMQLGQTRTVELARVEPETLRPGSRAGGGLARLARLFLGTAEADANR